MDYTTEEYFKKEKERFYNEIMSSIEPDVERALDKEYAYSHYFTLYYEGHLYEKRLQLELGGYIIIERYKKHRMLNAETPYSSFFNDKRSIDEITGFIALQECDDFKKKVYLAKKELLNSKLDLGSESGILLIKSYLLSKQLLNETFINKKSEIEITISKRISNVLIYFDVMHEVLLKVGRSRAFLPFVETIREDYDLEFSEGWQRVQLKIFDLGLEEKPKDFVVYDFPPKEIKPSIESDVQSKQIVPIEWKGTQGQLGALFVELHEKGWIKLVDKGNRVDKSVVETLITLFNVKTKINDIFKPIPAKGVPTWDMIKRGKWDMFITIKKNPNTK